MLTKITHLIKHYKLPILSGVLIGTSYVPFPPWASFFAFIPLWIFWTQKAKSAKEVVISGWIAGFLLSLIGFNWVIYTIHEFGRFSWGLSFIGLLLFCAIANLDMALSGLVWWLAHKKLRPSAGVSLALLAVITCFFEAYFPTIFSWNYGYPLYWIRLPIYQLAELIGFQGLSFIVIFFNLAIWRRLYKSSLAIFLFLNVSGYALQKSLPEPDREAKFLIVQANIGNLEKQMAEKGWGFQTHIIDRYTELTKQGKSQAPEPPQFVLWPETAFPATISLAGQVDGYLLRLINFVREENITLLTGGYGESPKNRKISNSIFVIEPDGSIRPDPYSKTKLLAFGEYIPFADSFPILKKWIPAGDFEWGKGLKTEVFGELKLGPQICYESLFPEFSVELANLGTQIIINVTNDSWYGTWQEPYQHMIMTLARGIEVRRPVVRATNTGISTVSLADGTILERSPMTVEWTGFYTVPFYSEPRITLYQKFPWLMDAVLLFMTVFLLGKASFGRPKKP